MQESILYIVLILLFFVIYLLLNQKKNKDEDKNKEELNRLKESFTNSINTMSTSFNNLSKDVTRDKTQALTKVDDRGQKTPIDLQDNEYISLGTGNDLQIFHNGTDSFLKNSTGDLRIDQAAASSQASINSNIFKLRKNFNIAFEVTIQALNVGYINQIQNYLNKKLWQ